MDVHTQIDHLAVRLSDPEKKITDAFKLQALDNSQYTISNFINHGYLSNLKTVQTNVTATSGVMPFSSLTYDVAKGEEGILSVKVYNGRYAHEIKAKDRKGMENTFENGTTKNPLYCVIGENIYIYPTTVAALDVTYIRQPTTLLNVADISAHGTPSTTQFLGDDSQDLVETDGFYNGALVHSVTQGTDHVVTDYAASGRTFTVSPAATANFGDDEIYFTTDVYDTLALTGVYSDLNESLHTLMMDFAEAECWARAGKKDQRDSVHEVAMLQVKMLNQMYTEATGIGTKAGM